jgi:uncharacterized membrane protein YfcA
VLSLQSDPLLLATLAVVTFLLAGCLKGVIGMGLPTLAIGLLGMVLPTMEAAALLVIPAFLTNLWQAIDGRAALQLVRRLWPMLVAQMIGVGISWSVWGSTSTALLPVVLGGVLLIYGLTGLAGASISIDQSRETPGMITAGWLSGMVTGVTGTLAIPAVMFLQALGLTKDHLVQAMGLSFAVSSLTLGALLFADGQLSGNTGWLGLLAVVAAACDYSDWLRNACSQPGLIPTPARCRRGAADNAARLVAESVWQFVHPAKPMAEILHPGTNRSHLARQ